MLLFPNVHDIATHRANAHACNWVRDGKKQDLHFSGTWKVAKKCCNCYFRIKIRMDSGWWSTNPLALKCVICLLLHFTASPIFFFESNKYKCVQCSQFFSSKKPPIYFQLSELFVKDYLDLYVLTFAHKLVSPLCTHFMYIYIYVDTYRSGDIIYVVWDQGWSLILECLGKTWFFKQISTFSELF